LGFEVVELLAAAVVVGVVEVAFSSLFYLIKITIYNKTILL